MVKKGIFIKYFFKKMSIHLPYIAQFYKNSDELNEYYKKLFAKE